jgi:TolB-like protein/Flp pilus assembly protein TadD/predicted Ser/Thr protein kinase
MVAQNNDNQAAILEEALTRFVDECLQGEKPDIGEFVRQYPLCEGKLKERIQDLQEIDYLFNSLVRAHDSEFDVTAASNELIGKKLASFHVEKVIGRGGMGVVYLARDTKLDRYVAIKSLPSGLLSSSTAKARFKREAKLLASMNHPNIAVIYDIIEHDEGLTYLILEYVPGQTLARRIAKESLELEQALSIARQIAEAVSAAHEKGVVHRDLKPGNINITPDDRVKVLDFGLAKAIISEGKGSETTATRSYRVIGTPAYMSPEQACAKPIDKRSDIWSFGCLMYEMLTGKVPFDGGTTTEIIARIIERQPDWDLLPNETPDNIRVLLRRCLEKNQDERLGDIADAAIEIGKAMSKPTVPVRTLWRWAMAVGFVMVAIVVGLNIGRWREQLLGGAGPVQFKSLAVLPLENRTGDSEQEYFADGITDALVANLAKIGALQVRSRTSIMQYKDIKKPLSVIARELNVDVVVEGSVMRVGNQVRITAQLIHAPTDTHLWAESYERDLRDILTLLNEVSRTIASQIEITLTPEEETLLVARRPINPETYEAYLKGMFLLHKETPEGTRKGLEYLHRAIEKVPEDPLLYGGLALGYIMSTHGPGAPPNAFEQARAAALKALELDDMLAEAHAALAMTKVYRDWDWEGAAEAYRRALQLNPNLTLTRAHYAFYLLLLGSTDEALAQMKKVQEMDPLTPLWPAWQGWLYLHAEQFDEAIKETEKSLELYSDFHVALYVQGRAYAGKGMYEQAVELHQKAGDLSPQWKCGLAHTYAMAGRQDEARQALAELEANHTPWDTWFIALVYVALGNKDQAFRWLEVAYGPPNHPYIPFIKCVPLFKPLRDDPRFADLLRRMNLSE